MTHNRWRHVRPGQLAAMLAGSLLVTCGVALAQGGNAAAERVAALKASLAASHKQLQGYEWIETTIVSLKGEEKSRKQQRCYYGADGALQKLPVDSGAPPAQGGGGGRRRGGRLKQAIVENKKEALQEYMERAASLVHHYVPPDADRLEEAKTAGKLALRPGAAGAPSSIEISDYLKAGDRLGFTVNPSVNRLVGLEVASYLDEPGDAVTLRVRFGALPDGTSYAEESVLDAPAKNIRVVVQNSGYRPVAR